MESLTVRVITLGCKVNQCESASVVAALRAQNIDASEGLEPADVYVLNTCSVTAEADKKSRQNIAKMRKLNPDCSVIVVGCSTQNNPNKFKKQNVIAIGGTAHKVEIVLNTLNSIKNNDKYNTISDIILYENQINTVGKRCDYNYEPFPVIDKTRAFVKIQDGCNRFCSYCIIPYLRGRSRSRSIDDIVKECSQITSREIVLTGIDVSSYGRDIGETFEKLLSALSELNMRKRLSSLECEVIDCGVLRVMKEGNYCPHFHLSLQSGSDEVLKTMNRRYDCDYFYSKIELVRKYFPNAGITTDVIVGFPTETDEFFEKSCEFIKKCAFADIHVFPYSSRVGTLASKKYSALPPSTVKARVDKLLEIKHALHSEFLLKNLGQVASVYVEDEESGYNVGYTPNYIKVYSTAPRGSVIDLRLIKLMRDGIYGEIL